MDHYLNEEYRKEAIGLVIYHLRKQTNVSLKQLADSVGISSQYLHEIEKGKKKSNIKIYQSIFEKLNATFYDDSCYGQKYVFLFYDMIDAYIDMNPNKRKLLSQELLTDPHIQTSYYHPIYYLTKFIFNELESEMGSDDEDIKDCLKVYSLFSKQQRAIFYYFRGIHAFVHEPDKAQFYFHQSLNESSTVSISAMAYYMVGKNYVKTYNFAKAIDYLNLSKDVLVKQNHFHRTVYPMIVLGIVYSLMRQTSLMENYFLSASKIALQYNDKKNHFLSMENIAFSHLRLCNYDQCIRYSLQLLQEGYTDYYLYYSLAWSYYMQGNKINAAKYRDLLVKYNKHEYLDVDNYEICLNYLLDGKYEAYFKKLKKYYETCKHKNPIEDNEVLLERLVAYCDQNNLVEEGYYYQKEYIKLLKKS